MSPALQRRIPLLATAAVFVALYATAGFLYEGFFSARVFANLLIGYAMLGITAVGLTLVIFSGGIDLSVGAVAGFASIFTATLVQNLGWHPLAASALALLIGAGFGAGMGALIHVFRQPPFLITLAGMFLMRGLGFWITTDQVAVSHPWMNAVGAFELTLGSSFTLLAPSVMLLGALLLGGVLAHYTRFGRNLLALGGNEQSALLMGLPVGPTKIAAYAVSGLCAAFAGLSATFATGTGNPSLALGLELDAIAVVVIGGTILTGGRGHMLGTVLGLLIFGTIQSALEFDGRLDSAWLKTVVGALLLGFILLQRLLVSRLSRR
jgi:simple sugar transport system permease protein